MSTSRRKTVATATVAVAIAAVSVAVVLDGGKDGGDGPPPAADAAPPEAAEPAESGSDEARTYERVVARLDELVVQLRERSERRDDWGDDEALASTYLSRARITGDYDDYTRAERALDRAFERAGEGSGPRLLRAQWNYAVHRLEPIEEDLRAVDQPLGIGPDQLAEIRGLRGDVALHQSRYEDALRWYEDSLRARRTPTGLFRLGQYYLAIGDFERGAANVRAAEEAYRGYAHETRAWFALQRGLVELARGRYDAALEHYRRAEGHLAGWWLVDEHIAEVLALTGQRDEAIRMYRDIIRRTGNPEFLDALADLVPDPERSELIARARRAWEQRLESHPEAAIGHALDHFLEHGDPARALELAQRNVALRPSGEARVTLARAYLENGRAGDAKREIEAVLATPYRSAELHATAAEVYEREADTARAESERAKALALSPHALD